MRKTKIVVTIGPSTESEEMAEKILSAGMDVARLNFSHGDTAVHEKRLLNIRAASEKTGLPCMILQDLGGPKIRIGDFAAGAVTLKDGDEFTLTTDYILGDQKKVTVNYPNLPHEVKVGHFIFLRDGTVKLQVAEIKGADVVCRVLIGGESRDKSGVNLPNSNLSAKSLTDKDIADLEFGIKNKVDFVALSFVRSAADISELRKILDARGCGAKIVAKIETPQAMQNIDDIILAADILMVARGDLAIETAFEKVPIEQKVITEKCNSAGKSTIVATQMMESMIKNTTPTRAEVSDVANAVLDGAEMVMLSEETALGDNPELVVRDMAAIIAETERDAGIVKNEMAS
jgi:pyruvate kinase